jgi:MarR family transcriptional regulator, lower aerobic nicotinate degradation pathway regulator
MSPDAVDPEPIRPGPLTFQASTWYLLAMAGSQARHRWANMLRQLEVSPSQYKVLRALGESGPLSQNKLAEIIAVDPRNLVPLVDRLAERGLVAREMDPRDRRRRVLSLTGRGQRLATDLASIGAQVEQDFLSPLSSGDQQALREMLLSLLRADC